MTEKERTRQRKYRIYENCYKEGQRKKVMWGGKGGIILQILESSLPCRWWAMPSDWHHPTGP